MPTMNMIQALNSALDVMLTRDPDVLKDMPGRLGAQREEMLKLRAIKDE